MFERLMVNSENNYYSVGQLESFMFVLIIYFFTFGVAWYRQNINYSYVSFLVALLSFILMFVIS